MSRHENSSVLLKLEDVQRIVTQIIKKVKDYSYMERLEELGLTNLLERRMRADLIKTFKIINGISIVDIFPIFLLELEIYCQDRFNH